LSPFDYQQEKDMKTGSQVCTGLTACPTTQLYKPHAELETAGSKAAEILVCFTNPLRVGNKFSEEISATSEIHRELKGVFRLGQVF
jgi:hypothetical protein